MHHSATSPPLSRPTDRRRGPQTDGNLHRRIKLYRQRFILAKPPDHNQVQLLAPFGLFLTVLDFVQCYGY